MVRLLCFVRYFLVNGVVVIVMLLFLRMIVKFLGGMLFVGLCVK